MTNSSGNVVERYTFSAYGLPLIITGPGTDGTGRTVISAALDPSDCSAVTWSIAKYDATATLTNAFDGGTVSGDVVVSESVDALGNSTQVPPATEAGIIYT